MVHSQKSLAQHLPTIFERLSTHSSYILLLYDHVVAHARKVRSAYTANLEALRASNQSILIACADTVK